jgi:hypothetical protein
MDDAEQVDDDSHSSPAAPGLARHPGDRVGFTPTKVLLAALIPFYDRYKAGSGVSMDVLREELTRAPFFQDKLWLIPTLEQLSQWWASENARASRPMVGVGSRVVMAAKPKRPRKRARDDGSGGGGGGSGGGGGGGGGADEGLLGVVLCCIKAHCSSRATTEWRPVSRGKIWCSPRKTRSSASFPMPAARRRQQLEQTGDVVSAWS